MRIPLSPLELIDALFSLPVFSLVLAAVITGVFVIARRTQPVDPPERYRPELRVLGFVAIGVIVIYAIENIVRGYLLQLPDVVDWWRYPMAIFAALVGLGVVGVLIAVRGSSAPELPVAPTARRGWTTFGPRAGLASGSVVAGALLATCVLAGLASSADADGRFIYLELEIPNTSVGPVLPWFFGWWYGIPVMIATVALAAAVWVVLSRNATRPYVRPELVPAEQDARRRVARSVVSISTAAMLLALGGAWRFIDRGMISGLTNQDNETFEVVWRYSALANAAGWLAPVLEVVGFTLLLVTAVRTLRRTHAEARADIVTEEVTR